MFNPRMMKPYKPSNRNRKNDGMDETKDATNATNHTRASMALIVASFIDTWSMGRAIVADELVHQDSPNRIEGRE